MKKERYKARCPGYIFVADLTHTRGHDKDPEAEKQVIESQPPSGVEMRIELEKSEGPFDESMLQAVMELYFAPGIL